MDTTPRNLGFTATTRQGRVVDFQLPLHPHTASAAQVASMLESILDALTGIIEHHRDVSDGDVLQAMSLAMAVRMGVAGIGENPGRQLLDELLSRAMEGALTAAQASGSTRH